MYLTIYIFTCKVYALLIVLRCKDYSEKQLGQISAVKMSVIFRRQSRKMKVHTCDSITSLCNMAYYCFVWYNYVPLGGLSDLGVQTSWIRHDTLRDLQTGCLVAE